MSANLIDENIAEENAQVSGDITELSAGNLFNNAKLNKPRLPPIDANGAQK